MVITETHLDAELGTPAGLHLAKLIQTSGGLGLDGVKCTGLFGTHTTI